jgi:hypothetical protein
MVPVTLYARPENSIISWLTYIELALMSMRRMKFMFIQSILVWNDRNFCYVDKNKEV